MAQYSNAQIRNLLTTVFEDEEEFEFFVEDHFGVVRQQFTDDLSFKRKAQILSNYCRDNNSLNKLVTLIHRDYPEKFAEIGLPLPASDGQETSSAEEPASTASPEIPADQALAEEAATYDSADTSVPAPAPPPANDVFISYSRKDEAFVKQLYQALSSRGISTWYDRENIRVGKHWPTEIAEGIEHCRIFLLSLSPDSAASENVRKEADLAQRHRRQIVPLIWRATEIPPNMQYQLAGIQWIEFNQEATEEKFDQLAEVLKSLLGGASLTHAATDKTIATEAKIPAIEEEEEDEEAEAIEQLSLVLTPKKKVPNPVSLGGSVISSVVTQFDLDSASQDAVNLELKWLFGASAHLLKIFNRKVAPTQPIPVDIPPTATPPDATNRLVDDTLDSEDLGLWVDQLNSNLMMIVTHLKNLDVLLDREVRMGEEGKRNIHLQNQIREGRVNIVQKLQRMAHLMNQLYGVLVTSPDQLLQFLR